MSLRTPIRNLLISQNLEDLITGLYPENTGEFMRYHRSYFSN